MKRKQKLLLLAVMACLGTQTSVSDAKEVVSEASRTIEVEADTAKEEAKYNSQSVTVITQKDIARKQAKSVEDVIFNEVGVTRTIDAMGNVGVSIRGADPRHTLIIVDGQRVLGGEAKYNGSGDELLRIGAENIERIEIIRGAAGAKYGADAIGCVINVVTKKGTQDPSLTLNLEGRYHSSRKHSGTDANGYRWDKNMEYYGSATPPPLSYEEALSEELDNAFYDPTNKKYEKILKKLRDSNESLRGENNFTDSKFEDVPGAYVDSSWGNPILGYYGARYTPDNPAYRQVKDIKYKGKYFKEEFEKRHNQVLIGEAELKKTYAFLEDSYLVNAKTILNPIVRLDHSDLFGTHLTANIGITHSIDSHRRLKANIGTSYAEPGLG